MYDGECNGAKCASGGRAAYSGAVAACVHAAYIVQQAQEAAAATSAGCRRRKRRCVRVRTYYIYIHRRLAPPYFLRPGH